MEGCWRRSSEKRRNISEEGKESRYPVRRRSMAVTSNKRFSVDLEKESLESKSHEQPAKSRDLFELNTSEILVSETFILYDI